MVRFQGLRVDDLMMFSSFVGCILLHHNSMHLQCQLRRCFATAELAVRRHLRAEHWVKSLVTLKEAARPAELVNNLSNLELLLLSFALLSTINSS